MTPDDELQLPSQVPDDMDPTPFGRQVRQSRRFSWPVIGSVAVHGVLVAGALMIEAPAAARSDQPVEIMMMTRLVSPAGGGGAAAVAEAPAAAPAARPIREARPRIRKAKPKPEVSAAPRPTPAAAEELPPEPVELVDEDLAEAVEEPEDSLLASADDEGSSSVGVEGGFTGGGPMGVGGGDLLAMGGGVGSGMGSAFGTGLVDGSRAAVAPKIREQVQPDYPRVARRRGIEGLVVLHLVVGRDGAVEPAYTKVLESVPGLDAAAVAAANRWRFSPARDSSGSALRSFIRLPIRFSLR